jgi:cytochrome c oxidase assembly protein subunit 15
MPDASSNIHRRAIRLWLLAVAGLVLAMVLVGGATRLTESGLSIVEWKPVAGALPPLTETQWQAEFDKYKTIPQYAQMNAGMTLGEFKTIFWWEWTHRLLGRAIGAAFLLPFVFFLWRGWIEPGLRGRLWGIFGLGALQGAVGWWMVASGLVDRVEVSQYRLAFHLTLASLIYVALLWTAGRSDSRAPVPPRRRAVAWALVVLVLIQIYLGALVAGLRAGLIYNTWPLIDDALVPAAARLLFEQPLWRNFFENTLTVQFDHRMAAYAIWIVAVLHAFDVWRNDSWRNDTWRADTWRTDAGGRAARGALLLAAAVTLQALLGILTLLHQVPLMLALAHQAMAMVVLTLAVLHAARMTAVAQPAKAELATSTR